MSYYSPPNPVANIEDTCAVVEISFEGLELQIHESSPQFMRLLAASEIAVPRPNGRCRSAMRFFLTAENQQACVVSEREPGRENRNTIAIVLDASVSEPVARFTLSRWYNSLRDL